jgi:hypothetical protein
MVCKAEKAMFNARYATDPLRVALSLIAGAVTYAILMVLCGFLDTLKISEFNLFWIMAYDNTLFSS